MTNIDEEIKKTLSEDKSPKLSTSSNASAANESDRETISDDQISEGKAPQTVLKTAKKKHKGGRFYRIFQIFISLIMVLILLIAGALFFFTSTEKGLQVAVNGVNKYLSQFVEIESAQGVLSRDISLHNLRIQIPNQKDKMVFEDIVLRWDLWALLDKKLLIESLMVNMVDLRFVSSETKAPKIEKEREGKMSYYPFSFQSIPIPYIKLIEIEQIKVNRLALNVDDMVHILVNQFNSKKLSYDTKWITIEGASTETVIDLKDQLSIPVKANVEGTANIQNDDINVLFSAYSEQANIFENRFNMALSSRITGTLAKGNIALNGRVDWLDILNDPMLVNLDAEVKDQVAPSGWVKINHLKVKNMDNQLDLMGQWSLANPTQLTANLSIDATKLSQIYPNMAGKIVGDLSIKGDIYQPLVEGNLLVESLNAFTVSLDKLTLKAKHNEEKMLEAHLAADHIRVADNLHIEAVIFDALGDINDDLNSKLIVTKIKNKDQLLGNAELTLEGALLGHKVNVNVDSPFATMEVKGIGRLENIMKPPLKWTFYVEDTNILSSITGQYKLVKPTYIFVEAQDILLSSFCLQNQPIVFCLEGKREPGNMVGTATLNNLSSSLLEGYLPKNLKIDTSLQAIISGQFKNTDDYVGVAHFSLAQGRITYQLRGRAVDVPLKSTFLEAHATPKKFTSQLNVDWGDYLRATGKGSVDNLFNQPTVDATIEAHIPAFDWIGPLFPYLKNIKGKIGANAKISGSLLNPDLTADFGIQNANVNIEGLNATLSNITLQGFIKQRSPIVNLKGHITAGQGTLNITGDYNIRTQQSKIIAQGQNLRLADIEDIKLMITPDITFEYSPKKSRLSGNLLIPELTYIHSNMYGGLGKVKGVSSDAIIVSKETKEKDSDFMSTLEMDFLVVLGDKISVGASGFSGALKGGIKLRKELMQPIKGIGVFDVGKGEYTIYGQKLNLDRGRVNFSGNMISNPSLDFQATRSFDGDSSGRKIQVGVKVTGSVKRPKVALFSQPVMSEMAIASYLFLGRAPDSSSQSENLMLLDIVRKIAMGQDPIANDDWKEKMGLTDIGLTQDRSGNAAFGIGKQVNKNLYVGLGVGIFREGAFATLRYKFLKYFNFDSQFSSDDTSVDVIYSRELN